MDVGTRITCLRCRRPEQVCVCAELRPTESRTHVVFVQHPREARMPVSTCRLAHRSLPNSEMHVALGPEGNPRLEALARAPGTMLLFPGPGSTDVTELSEAPRTLVVVDGTWINARKVVERSPLLSALPRIGFTPSRPGNYRIRKEPAEHCLSTIEAVAYVLEALEAAPGRYTPILGSFDRMVDLQLAYIGAAPLHANHAPRHAPPKDYAALASLRRAGDRRVLVFTDGNAWTDGSGPPAPPELLHWVAVRPATGERFASVLRPRLPVAPYVPRRLGLRSAALEDGESITGMMERWRRFGSADDVVCTWGPFSADLMRAAGVEAGVPQDPVDIKQIVARVLNARFGGVEALAERHGAVLPEGGGFAPRTLAALEVVVRALVAGELRGG